MKKILLLSLLLFSTAAAYCEDEKDDTKRPNGFRVGYLWGNLINSNENAADNLNSFYVGFARTIKISPLFRFETGMEYLVTGAQQTEQTKLQMGYLVFPAQFKVKIGPFFGLAGINGNFKVYQKVTIDGQNGIVNDGNKAAFFDLPADVGAGINIVFISVEARYYWGLINVKNGWFNRYAEFGLKFNF